MRQKINIIFNKKSEITVYTGCLATACFFRSFWTMQNTKQGHFLLRWLRFFSVHNLKVFSIMANFQWSLYGQFCCLVSLSNFSLTLLTVYIVVCTFCAFFVLKTITKCHCMSLNIKKRVGHVWIYQRETIISS